MPSEFDVIRRFFTRPTPQAVLGGGDDAALIQVTAGMELAVSTDMLVAGRHFFSDADPFQLGYKSLAVNLSDMAAMGARPHWATLSLCVPGVDERWLSAFSQGFFSIAHEYGVDLVGGDTTRGPLLISVQIMGEVPVGQALRRDGAKPGDEIWVSGHLGDAALALAHLQHRMVLMPHEAALCLPALHMPTPRIELGQHLREVANSAIDISDGLLADLGHILERSNVAAEIEFTNLPASDTLRKYLHMTEVTHCLLAGGDDYELCFTAPVAHHEDVVSLSHQLKLTLTCIGKIKAGKGLALMDSRGKSISYTATGFDHFAE